jgi:hypothetical protein
MVNFCKKKKQEKGIHNTKARSNNTKEGINA